MDGVVLSYGWMLTIKLDDTVELYIMKIGQFIERGYDEAKGQKYYKIFFRKKKSRKLKSLDNLLL